MLLVNARKGPSKIHGLGLIAQEFIPAGTRVWELRVGFDVVMTEAQMRELPPVAQEHVWYYSFRSSDAARPLYIMPGDDDRYTNHSDDPNTKMLDASWVTVATRDIPVGEELTWDYRPWAEMDFQPAG